MEQKELVQAILELKKQKDAIILVHNYQKQEIYQVADFIGDSLDLAKKAALSSSRIIVFCGVDFMAETAKILNPSAKVLLPARTATCPMANMVTVETVKRLKKIHPEAAVVSYVNTNADVKSESDICCTSMNAISVVNSLKANEVIFLPDINLGRWVAQNTSKEIILCEGYCLVHHNFREDDLISAKNIHKDAVVIAHPEAPLDILNASDHVTGTGGMIEYVKKSKADEFIILTEEGMVNRLKKEIPHKRFFTIPMICQNMKKNSLDLVYHALQKEEKEITVPLEILTKAKKALDAMINCC